MLLIRDVFQIDPDSMREAKNVVRQMLSSESGIEVARPRFMTDLVGDYFTLVLEFEVPDLASYETTFRDIMSNDSWRASYERFRPMILGGHREIFQIEE